MKKIGKLKHRKLYDQNGKEIIEIVQMTPFRDGWVFVTRKGEIYSDVDFLCEGLTKK